MKIKSVLVTLFVVHIALALFHLNHTPMWDDEASVVWFAKNYNKYGKIIAYDGKNIFSYRNGQLINNQLDYNNPPLDIYYTAYIIRFFGDSDYTIRLSFAILGFIALAIYLWCLKLIIKGDKLWLLYTSVFLTLSVNYLLIEGNARYYSLNFLFAATSLLATLKIVQEHSIAMGRKMLYFVLQLVAIYFFFLSHYLAAVCWWVMCLFILWQQQQIKISLKDRFTWIVVFASSILFGFMVWYFIVHNTLSRPDLANKDPMLLKYSKLAEWLVLGLHQMNVIPWWTLLVFLYLFLFRRSLLSQPFKQMLAYCLIFIITLFLLDPQPTENSGDFEVRYLYVIFPALYACVGYLCKLLHEHIKNGKWVAIVLSLIFINSTLLSAVPSPNGPMWLLPNYIKERAMPFPTAYSESIKYIQQHFNGRKKILTLPGFHNTVFLRYVNDKITITNTLDEKTTPLSHRLIDSLGMDCLYIGHCKPDYVFQFGVLENIENYPFQRQDFKFVDTILVYADGFDITRPELLWHSFGPRKIKDTTTEALYIYHD